MSTPSIGSTPQASAPITAPSGEWGQIAAGPQAIGLPALLAVMSTLEEIMVIYQQQAENQALTANSAAQAAAKSTVASALAQASGTFCEMGMSFAGAAVAGAGAIFTTLASKPTLENLETANTEKNTIGIMQEQLAKPVAQGSSVGSSPAADPNEAAINARIRELTTPGRDFAVFKDQTKATETITVNGQSQNLNEAAISHMSPEQLASFKDQLKTAYDANSRTINDGHTTLQTTQQRMQMYQSIAGGGINAAFQAGQAKCQSDQGQDQAKSTLANNIAQQCNNMFNTNQGFITKFYDQAMQSLSMLQQLSAAASVH